MKSVLFITGCNGGIGLEICKFFKSYDWTIIGIDKKDMSNDYVDIFYQIDLTDPDQIIRCMSQITRIDCLLHCAAQQYCKPIWEYTLSEWHESYACNVDSVFLMIKYAIDVLKKYQTNIIIISSIHSVVTSKHIAAYASTKSALTGLTKNLAIDLAEFKIRVNSISPGAVNTNMLREHLSPEQLQQLQEKHLLHTIGQPKQIAETCWFLIQNEFMNGANLIIDGGVSSRLYTE